MGNRSRKKGEIARQGKVGAVSSQTRPAIPIRDVPNPPLNILHQTSFQGPLPPPEILAQYDKIHPGLADRVVAMAEREAQHRHCKENALISGYLAVYRWGQKFAFFIAIAGLGAAVYAITKGHPATASIICGSSLGSLVVAFLKNRNPDDSEHGQEKKRQRS